jgi:hypothetical protein
VLGVPYRDLCSRVHVESLQDVLHVVGHGTGREHQRVSDLLIGVAESDQARDLQLPRGQGPFVNVDAIFRWSTGRMTDAVAKVWRVLINAPAMTRGSNRGGLGAGGSATGHNTGFIGQDRQAESMNSLSVFGMQPIASA